MAIRAKVVSEGFKRLGQRDQQPYIDESFAEHSIAIAKWERAKTGPPSEEPKDRQRCVQLQFL